MSESMLGFEAGSDEFLACMRLAAAELPPHRLRALIDTAGLPLGALELPVADLRGPRVALTEKQTERWTQAVAAEIPRKTIERGEALQVRAILASSPSYPESLRLLPDAPAILFVLGSLQPDDRFSVAVVGSRRATSYGLRQTERFVHAFVGRGLAIVSGGAAGIDTAAHRTALSAGGRTIAVLGCGVDISYPAENRSIFEQIVEQGGAIISEFPLQTRPEPWRFPTRNRIIAGMARATLLLETPKDSGALITARKAADYGRDVWVVPGPVDTGRSRGGHLLIQDGAYLADSPDDVLVSLGLAAQPKPTILSAPAAAGVAALPGLVEPRAAQPLPELSDDERALLQQFDLTPRHLDEATVAAELPAARANVAVTMLEVKGLLRRQPGSQFIRAL